MSSYGFQDFEYNGFAYPADSHSGAESSLAGAHTHHHHHHPYYNQPQPEPVVPVVCLWRNCGVPLDDLSGPGMRRHLQQFHAADMPPKGSQAHGGVACQWNDGRGACQTECRSAVAHGRHVSTVHLGQGRMVCRLCTKQFSRKDALKRHQEQYCPALRHGLEYGA